MTTSNVTFTEFTYMDGSKETYAIIDRGNGEFTSMTKATYDAQQEALANGNNPVL